MHAGRLWSLCPACEHELRWSAGADGAAFDDHGTAAVLVRAAKFGRSWAPVSVLAALTDERSSFEVDVVTWVPADPWRRRRRGWHLPERFARALARQLSVPATALLRRTRHLPPQRGSDRQRRLNNVAGAFDVLEGRRLAGLDRATTRVLLIDDVRTTGATLAAAAAPLRAAGLVVEEFAIVRRDRRAVVSAIW